jgi:prepilin-type N-terminal cleavage/methylation domain-containing protein
MTPVHRPLTRKAFTLIEMLVVIGIITLLAAILIPVVSQVRVRAAVANTQGEMMRIMGACQMYYHDFNAYPGPLAENMLVGAPSQVDSGITLDPFATQKPTGFDSKKITSSENLVLGLVGLLSPADAYNTPPRYGAPPPKHDVMSLNYTHPASYHYLDFLADELPLPTGSGADYYAFGGPGNSPPTDMDTTQNPPVSEAKGGNDSTVPEFMDHIPNPMPILYLRANRGVPVTATTGIVMKGSGGIGSPAQYDLTELAPYGFNNINYQGSPKVYDFPAPVGVTEPSGLEGWWMYFMNPGVINEPRGKDAFILIDAGADRLYGTKDDIIVTP